MNEVELTQQLAASNQEFDERFHANTHRYNTDPEFRARVKIAIRGMDRAREMNFGRGATDESLIPFDAIAMITAVELMAEQTRALVPTSKENG